MYLCIWVRGDRGYIPFIVTSKIKDGKILLQNSQCYEVTSIVNTIE